MKSLIHILAIGYIAAILSMSLGCQKTAGAKENSSEIDKAQDKVLSDPFIPTQQWNQYWYKGLAELTSYTLKQSRYGEMHEGTVVNVFVTEDFSKSKQVKLDNVSAAGNDKLPILKLNQSIKFMTGVYPYSLMLSSFMPVELNNNQHAAKITGIVEEWCGIAYFQLNNKQDKYSIESRSYFESEGDRNFSLEETTLEDEIWNIIRIDPAKLPVGDENVLPGTLYLRLSHKPIEAVKAKLSLKNENNVSVYTIEYSSLSRILNIEFEQSFPHRILSWNDTYPGIDGKILTTSAIKNKEILLDYWAKHTVKDSIFRTDLGLPEKWQ